MAARKAAEKSAKKGAAAPRSAGKSAPTPARKASSRKAPARKKAVKAIPDGYYTATPYLYLSEAGKAIEFYKRAFGATEMTRMGGPEGRVMHAELKIGNSIVMMADEFPEMNNRSPRTLGGASGSILLYVPDVDAAFARAVKAGAKATRPVELQFWGDKMGALEDPFGHQWSLATHVEDVSPEEMERRMNAFQPPSGG
jgi:PhnB protein